MNFSFNPSGDPLCLANIRACAEASRLAYVQPTLTESGESVLIREVGTVVPTVRSDSCLIIAFPGTHDLRDVLRDIDCVRVRATILGRPCSVHAGFARSHEALLPIWSARTCPRFESGDMSPQSTIKKIFITGHSKGAAVAKRCALALLEQNIPVHAVITFGEPRGGDARYAKIYNDVLAQRTLRITNAADPVPWLPAWLAGNRHSAPEAWLPPNSNPQPSTFSIERILPMGGRLKQGAMNRDERPTLLPLPEGPRFAKRTSLVGKLTCGGLGKPLGGVRGNTMFFYQPALDHNHQPSTTNPKLIYGPRLWWKLAQNFREIYQAWQLQQLTPLNDHHIDNYLRRLGLPNF